MEPAFNDVGSALTATSSMPSRDEQVETSGELVKYLTPLSPWNSVGKLERVAWHVGDGE